MKKEVTCDQQEEDFAKIKDSMEFGDLLEKLTNANVKIDLYKNIYQAEINSIPGRLKLQRFGMHLNMFILVVLMCIDAFFLVNAMSKAIMVQAVEGLLFLILLMFVLMQMSRAIKSFIVYNMNASPNFMTVYVATHQIHNMIEERRYCEGVLEKLLEYELQIRAIEASIEAKKVDVDEALNIVYAMDFDIKEFKYTEAFERS